jgi:hypothetical protein
VSLKSAYINILESGTVTLDAGTADSDFPLYRLHDRGVSKIFKTTAAVTTEVLIDQGASGNLAVDQLLIPVGHNLDGMTLDIEYSTDDISYTPAVAQWTGDANLVDKSWSALTKRYWKFTITSPGSIPEIPELFLTSTYTWERDPSKPAGPLDNIFNVIANVTASGQDRFLEMGDAKTQRGYTLPNISEAQKDELIALNNAWGGAKPFWVYDHTGAWLYVKLAGAVGLTLISHERYSMSFSVVQALT